MASVLDNGNGGEDWRDMVDGSAPRQASSPPPNAPLIISIPDEVLPYRDDIRRFVDAMIFKLKVHHRKGRWEGKTVTEYIPLLQGEVDELENAVAGGNMVEIITEGADVANMAMIIASIATERGK